MHLLQRSLPPTLKRALHALLAVDPLILGGVALERVPIPAGSFAMGQGGIAATSVILWCPLMFEGLRGRAPA